MDRVVLCGTDSKSRLMEYLVSYLKKSVSLTVSGDRVLYALGEHPQLEMFQLQELEHLWLGKSILCLRKRANLKRLCGISKDTTVIVPSSCRRILESISRFSVNVVTVGMSSKDTVTFSSHQGEEWVVSLQRSICTLHGQILEPMEIPISLAGWKDEEEILSFVTILLLLNQLENAKRICLESF
ncbi:MAG: hypothetical protein ACOX60_08750 [Massiliimalia sp.]|jgi:hypothetical protein